MKHAVARLAVGLVAVVLGAMACRQGEPGLDPKTPPNSPVPTRLDRPEEPKGTPAPSRDAGAAAPGAVRRDMLARD